MNGVRRRIRGEAYGESFPASTWVLVCALEVPDAMIEVEVTVALGARGRVAQVPARRPWIDSATPSAN